MKENVFQKYSAYYDLLYKDKDYVGEVAYVVRLLHENSPNTRKLLEFGSGTGKHGLLLAEQGFEVFGIEKSEAMSAAAQNAAVESPSRRSGKFDCLQGDVRSITIDETFDAVIALFHVVSYQTANDDLARTFSSAARHLNPGGVFMFDVWHGPAVLRERPSVRVKRVEDENTLLTRVAEPELDTNASVVTVHYTMLVEAKIDQRLTTFHEEHRMRYLFPTEIDLLARETGFKVERSEEFMTGNPASEKTWGVTYLLRKLQ